MFKLKSNLEKLIGEEITDKKLIDSIRKYNQLRDLLNHIRLLRKENPPPIGGEDFIKLNHYALRSDLDDAIICLERIVEELKRGETSFSDDAVRIMLIGRGIAFGDYLLLSMIEEAGGVVVSELFDEGMLRPEKVRENGAPLESISESYYKAGVPSVFLSPSFRKRWEYVSKKVKEFQVDGLIYYNLAFDVIYDHEWPIFAKWANEMDLPFIMVESNYSFLREATVALKSRVESFIEICRRNKK